MNDVHHSISLMRVLRLALLTCAFVWICGLPDSAASLIQALRALNPF